MHLPPATIMLVVLGVVGFCIALHIYYHKHKKKPLVCPFRSRCDVVVTSRYSSVFGISVEILGMAFYGTITLLNTIGFMYPMFSSLSLGLSLALSAIAFVFSLYLISIQEFILREWCVWCMVSALLSATIFLLTYTAVPVGILH